MGKGSKKSGSSGAAAAQRPQAAAPAVEATTDEKEQRFMQALKRMMGCTGEPTEEEIRKAITGLTQEQRQELLAEGQDLKKDLLNKPDLADNRKVFFSEVNTGADQAGMPISKDGEFLAKKVRAPRLPEKKRARRAPLPCRRAAAAAAGRVRANFATAGIAAAAAAAVLRLRLCLPRPGLCERAGPDSSGGC